MNVHPQYIEKLPADAFWFFVFKNGFQATRFPTKIEDIPDDLWSREILLRILKGNNNFVQDQPSEDLIDGLYYSVAEVIIDHNKKEKNILGILYQEDFKSCRDPDFAFQNLIDKQILDSDQDCHYDLQLKGKYLQEGELLLRTPFPSGILLKSRPSNNSILCTPNTLKALGFQKKILLLIKDEHPLPVNEYGYNCFVTGVFYIPTTQDYNLTWLKIVPNAVAILKGFQINQPNGDLFEGNILQKPHIKKNFLDKVGSFFC